MLDVTDSNSVAKVNSSRARVLLGYNKAVFSVLRNT